MQLGNLMSSPGFGIFWLTRGTNITIKTMKQEINNSFQACKGYEISFFVWSKKLFVLYFAPIGVAKALTEPLISPLLRTKPLQNDFTLSGVLVATVTIESPPHSIWGHLKSETFCAPALHFHYCPRDEPSDWIMERWYAMFECHSLVRLSSFLLPSRPVLATTSIAHIHCLARPISDRQEESPDPSFVQAIFSNIWQIIWYLIQADVLDAGTFKIIRTQADFWVWRETYSQQHQINRSASSV